MQKSRENPSAFRSEFWGICCESGKKYSQVVTKKFHLSMAALDPTASGTSPCVSLMVERGGCQYLLCNLKPDSVLQVSLNLFFDIGEKVTFFLTGRGTVHLSGYHIFQDGDKSLTNNFSKSPSRSPNKSIKDTILDSDLDLDEETDSDDDYDEDEDNEDSDDEVDDDEEEEIEDDLMPKKSPTKAVSPVQKTNSPGSTPAKKLLTSQAANKKGASPKAEIKAATMKAILKNSNILEYNKLLSKRALEEDSDDDDDLSDEDSEDSSEEEKAQLKLKSKDFQNNKKLKTNTSTPIPTKKMGNQNTPKAATEVIDLEDDTPKSSMKSFKGDPNSSIGRTPMPKKSMSSIFQPSFNDSPGNKKKKASAGDDESSDDDVSDEMDVSSANKLQQSSTEQLNTSTESKKKRRKKKKKAAAGANDSKAVENTPSKPNESFSAPKSAKKLPGGLEYEDLKVGYGLEAKKGKLVHVYYTGKLENNKVFDSRQPGSKPFSFKLGGGQVIKGWDVGLEGMKVGGKRKLKIPPHMAYKNQRMGDIPPSSTLNFVVELKAVS